MKIIAIGDIHGRNKWKQIVEQETDADKIIFIGDYFDTHDKISAQSQLDNFNEIIEFKKAHPEQVVLLCGNHDYHYFDDVQHLIGDVYSGFNEKAKYKNMVAVDAARDQKLLQMVFTHDDFIFSHAGITSTWLWENKIADLVEINDLFYKDLKPFRFTIGQNRSSSGDDITQSPIWVRPASLEKDGCRGTHVVGHTSVKKILMHDDIILIDALEDDQYLQLIDGVPSIKTI